MDLGTVSAAGMIGMAFAVLISIGLPVFLMLFLHKNSKAQIQFFLIGGGIFILSALILEQMCHLLVIGLAGGFLQKNFVWSAIYGGLAAAVFEETGRLIATKCFYKRKKLTMDNANAFMYGIGHGGAESILLVGIANINNLTTSIMLNLGALVKQLKTLEGDARTQAESNINQLISTPAVSFYMAGVERIFAIILQIALTILVYLGVKHAKKEIVLLAYAAHFLVDTLIVLLANSLNIVAAECLVATLTAAVGSCAYLLWQKYEKKDSK